MKTIPLDVINNLQKEDQKKISYFVNLLLKEEKYKKLRKEISLRKKEIKKRNVLTHDEIWSV